MINSNYNQEKQEVLIPELTTKYVRDIKYVELKQMLQTLYQYQLYGWGKYNKLQFVCVCFHLMQSLMLVGFIVLQQNSRIPLWNFEWQCKLQFTTQQKPF